MTAVNEPSGGWGLDEPDWLRSAPALVAGATAERPVLLPFTRERLATTPGGPPILVALSWTEIMAEPPEPPPMLANGIPKVGLTVLAGPPKVGKTLYASQNALGCRSTIVVEEGSLSGVSYRLRKQSGALGIDRPDVELIHRQGIRLDQRPMVARLRDHVAARKPALLVLDPLNRLHGADENRPTQMTPVMDALAGIAYDFGIAVLCIHHLSKPSAERRGDIWDRFRGATSIRSGTDANLILDGMGATVRLYGEFRDAEPLNETLELDRETLLFSVSDSPRTAGKVRSDELIAYLEEAGRATVAEVAARFRVTKQTARAALEAVEGLDTFEGQRGTRYYTLGTGK